MYIERERETVPCPNQRILRSRVLDPQSRDPRSPAHPCTTYLQNMPEQHKNGCYRKYEYQCMYSTIFNILTPLVAKDIILSDPSKIFKRCPKLVTMKFFKIIFSCALLMICEVYICNFHLFL
jgi:hypothetical protein